MFGPVIELYSWNNHLRTVYDDIKLVEIQEKSGFHLHDENLLLKVSDFCCMFCLIFT